MCLVIGEAEKVTILKLSNQKNRTIKDTLQLKWDFPNSIQFNFYICGGDGMGAIMQLHLYVVDLCGAKSIQFPSP